MGYLHNPILAKQHLQFFHQRLQAYLTRANNKYKIMRGTARYNKYGGTNGKKAPSGMQIGQKKCSLGVD